MYMNPSGRLPERHDGARCRRQGGIEAALRVGQVVGSDDLVAGQHAPPLPAPEPHDDILGDAAPDERARPGAPEIMNEQTALPDLGRCLLELGELIEPRAEA